MRTPHVLDLVVSFVKAHPELEQKDAADIVRWALSDEYPCPEKTGVRMAKLLERHETGGLGSAGVVIGIGSSATTLPIG